MASSQDFSALGDALVMQRSGTMPAAPATRSLDDLEGELHQLSADYETQIVLPELAEEAAAIDQEFEAEGAPEIQEAEVEFDFAHADFGVPHIAAMHSAGIKIEK